MNRLAWVLALGLLCGQDVFAACDQTFSTGNNAAIVTAVTNAANGTTICLNSGDYGTLTLANISRSGYVTLQSVSGLVATVNLQIGNSSYIRLVSLTVDGALINTCSHHIQVVNNTMTDGVLVTMRDASCSANLNLLIDGNAFGDLGPATYEGRLSVADDDGAQNAMGLTITRNTFGPGCDSDGIQLVGGASGVTIGPGNIFDGIVQEGETHCDMIQFYGDGENNTIVGNWFRNGSVVLTHHTSTPDNTIFRDNVITSCNQLQINQSVGLVFDHNTIYNLSDVFQLKTESGGSVTARSNILIGSTPAPDSTGGNLTASYNLCDAGDCFGTNQVNDDPTFIGGTPSGITTFAGWQLATGSLGENNGHDGRDRGTTNYNATPTAPSGVTVR